jgi:hypothetical protein
MNPSVPDISSLYQTPDITAAQNTANQTAQTATNYQSAADQLPAQLKDAIEQKLNYNSDIINEQAKAEANYFAAPAQARSDYQNVFNPFDREALVAQATANAYAPYQSLTNILGQRQGNITDLVNAGVGAFNSQVNAQQGKATIAQNNLQNLMANAQNLASAKEWQYQAGLPTTTGSGAIPAEYQQALAKDVQSGMTYSDLLARYGQYIPEFQVRQAYNQGPMAKRFGPAKETPQQENQIMQGLPGLTGAKSTAAVKTTLSPKTTTTKGNVKVNGWTLKLASGQSVFVSEPTGPQGGLTIGGFNIGGTPAVKPKFTAQEIYNQWKQSGKDENTLITALQNAGYQLQ